MPPVRIELTTLRLWDSRAAYCAKEALEMKCYFFRIWNVVLFFPQAVEDERPPIDLFKSIFTESSASELSEEEDSEEENKPPKTATITTDKEASTTSNAVVKVQQSIVQHKQLTDKSQHSTTEARGSLRDTAEPKLTWMGVSHTARPPEQTTPSTANKLHNKQPIVTAITSSHYGPSIPPSINGKLFYIVVIQYIELEMLMVAV